MSTKENPMTNSQEFDNLLNGLMDEFVAGLNKVKPDAFTTTATIQESETLSKTTLEFVTKFMEIIKEESNVIN